MDYVLEEAKGEVLVFQGEIPTQLVEAAEEYVEFQSQPPTRRTQWMWDRLERLESEATEAGGRTLGSWAKAAGYMAVGVFSQPLLIRRGTKVREAVQEHLVLAHEAGSIRIEDPSVVEKMDRFDLIATASHILDLVQASPDQE